MDIAQLELSRRSPAGGVDLAQANEIGDLLVAESMPYQTEPTRRGRRFGVMSTTAVAALVVRPSTVAAFEIFNGYGTGGKSLIIDRLFTFWLVSTAVVESAGLWAMVTAAKAAVTSGSFTVAGLSGAGYGGPVICAASTTVVDNKGWFPYGNGFSKAAAGVTPQGVVEAQINGAIIVPPQCSLCLHTVASLVGETFTHGAIWVEELIACE